MATSYEISNGTTNVRLNSFRASYSHSLFKCGETITNRQRTAQKLLNYLCDKFKINNVTLIVTVKPRPSKGRGEVYGTYYPLQKNIVIYNNTAKLHKPISIKSFYDTLLHEFIHHYDYEVLKLNESPHTTGFYKRITDLKNKLGD